MPRKTAKGLEPGMNLTAEGNIRVRITVDGRRRVVGTFDSLDRARRALNRAKSDAASGAFMSNRDRAVAAREAKATAAAEAVTLSEVFEQFIRWSERAGRAESTISTHRRRFDAHINDSLGSRTIRSITTNDVEDWYDALKGDGVKRGCYLTLSAVFSWAAGTMSGQSATFEPFIPSSPVRISGATKHKKRTGADDVVLTDEQIMFIADRMPPTHSAAVVLAGWVGLRIGEVTALRRNDFSEHDGVLWVRINKQVQGRGAGLYETPPKSSAGSRSLPLPQHVGDLMRTHLRVHVARPQRALVFPRLSDPSAWNHPNTLRSWFNAGVQAWNDAHGDAQLEHVVFHSLRHSALTRLGRAGATTAELMKFAGHSSPDMVAKYQHATRDRLTMLADRLKDSRADD